MASTKTRPLSKSALLNAKPANQITERVRKRGEQDSQIGSSFIAPDGDLFRLSDGKPTQSHLPRLLALRQVLGDRAAHTISFSPPILTQDGEGILWPHTIVLLQGQTGTHKSRVAELLASLLMAGDGFSGHSLGFQRDGALKEPCAVCYVDTERNLQEQFPLAIQKMKEKAGFQRSDKLPHFDFISLLSIPRTERLRALRDYLTHIRSSMSGHLVIILDQLADCVADFNDPKESMLLTDMLNLMVNEQDVTFVCIIHENPNSSKARGHLGTEMANKASTVLQLSFIKPSNGEQGEIIQLKYLKRRAGSPNLKFHVRYDAEQNELVRADADAVSKALSMRKRVAPIEAVIVELSSVLEKPLPAMALKDELAGRMETTTKTIGERIDEILSSSASVRNHLGIDCRLTKDKVGRESLYSLQPVQPLTSSTDVVRMK